MFVVDTNVLIYAANARAREHARCHALLEEWRHSAGAWYVTWGICYEFLRVVTHPRILPRPWSAAGAQQFLSSLFQSPGLGVLVATDRHAQVLAQVIGEVPLLAGNLMHDAETAVLMREHGVRRVCTRDTDFHRFAFLDVVDPMVAQP